MWHPLHLAEDFAMVVILMSSRVILSVGRGYHTREVESLGGPLIDMEANREICGEQVEMIFKTCHEAAF
jgi:alkanesulfonate monooxygenase SsuD/methylene tetrahydromethanopterin reductase-like flavin-dependent oxidoreductase (luciferase family)